MNQVQLIINGDDYGSSVEVNEAVVRAYKAGTLSSCSLMVTGAAFADAVRLAREHDGLAVGIHLVTVQGRAVLPPTEIPALVDGEGNFPDDPTHAGLRYYFSGAAREQLARELAAQFQRFHDTGLELSHVDSHLHMHIHPVIFAAAVRLAERYGVRRMRVPRDDFWLAARYQKKDLTGKAASALIFGMLTRLMRMRLGKRGFCFPERVYGHLLSGGMTLDYTLLVLDRLATATSEIYFHPGIASSGAVGDGNQRQRAGEFEILTSAALQARLQDARIKLTNYSGLATDP